MVQLDTPEFKNEKEEAEWWDANEKLLLTEFQKAADDGTLGHGILARKEMTASTRVNLDPQDAELARKQARHQGIDFQVYVQTLLHKALQQEAEKQDVAA